jgi:hypothetical protein
MEKERAFSLTTSVKDCGIATITTTIRFLDKTFEESTFLNFTQLTNAERALRQLP